jgi:predicted phosphoadenosine phosphosulfate sulfurtransferase
MTEHNIISFSGGKDSTAMLLLAIERETPGLSIVFADTGNEHEQTYDYVRYVEQATGVPIRWVTAEFGGCGASTGWHETKDEAIAAWNRVPDRIKVRSAGSEEAFAAWWGEGGDPLDSGIASDAWSAACAWLMGLERR